MDSKLIYIPLIIIIISCLLMPSKRQTHENMSNANTFVLPDCPGMINYSYQPVSPSALEKTPGIYNGRTILANGIYSIGFENSMLNNSIWLKLNPNAIEINKPPSDKKSIGRPRKFHVKAYGKFLHGDSKYGYGHLGMAKSQLNVDKIIYCQEITQPT